MENTSKSIGKKRGRDSDFEEETKSDHETQPLENNLTFSDTSIALRIMRAQFPSNNKISIQPFILRSQLYSSVNDRTQVDRELENVESSLKMKKIASDWKNVVAVDEGGYADMEMSLKKEKVLRMFKLNTGQDDHAIMFMEDYLNQIGSAEKKIGAKKKDISAVFDWFRTYVIVSKLDTSIEHEELCSLLSMGGKVQDEHISLIINAGLLTRQLIDLNMYWFAIPNIGSVLKGLSQIRIGKKIMQTYCAAILEDESREEIFF
ncbi:hypothetical protein GIB67_032394 [Kingdonia uniflora]|uniref:Uncharacterized protein n=1 Tax=Kingdonia uniflora TaxID=39325 RepID=A0A7J7MIY6_9MAGN|nr:hypothetical protein GIB67_032394 [Kingdonia uniflora]